MASEQPMTKTMEQDNKKTDYLDIDASRMVSRTERGWAGHFICADRCMFRRNTLLECGETRIVISSVGMMRDPKTREFDTVGLDRNFETMAFHAKRHDGRYWDADVSRQISFESNWAISEIDADDRANDMHEEVVREITIKLQEGYSFC